MCCSQVGFKKEDLLNEDKQLILNDFEENNMLKDGVISPKTRRLKNTESENERNYHHHSFNIEIKKNDQSNGEYNYPKTYYPLNYGSKKDTCLWKAFFAGKVSTQCASALKNVNYLLKNSNYQPNKSENVVRQKYVCVTIPIASFIALYLFYYVINEVLNDESEEEESESEPENDDNCSTIYIERLANVTVPVQVV